MHSRLVNAEGEALTVAWASEDGADGYEVQIMSEGVDDATEMHTHLYTYTYLACLSRLKQA